MDIDVQQPLSASDMQAASNEDLLKAYQSCSQLATRAGGERWKIIGANMDLAQSEILRRMGSSK